MLIIRGPSIELFERHYQDVAAKAGVCDRVILLPPVPSRDVVAASRGADAGIYTVLDVGKNFYDALPNKIFEYMGAGLPTLAVHYPEAKRIVDGFGVGLTFDPRDPKSIASAINKLADNRALRVEMSKRA